MDGTTMGGMWALGALWFLAGIVLIALMVTALVWLVRDMQRGRGTPDVDERRQAERR